MPLWALDVDAYDGKTGAASLEALEAVHGALPATYSSTSRGPGPSRIYFYRLPASAVRLNTLPGPGIETIQHHHRYAVVWPSRHPGTHETYRWYGPDGEGLEEGVVPSPDDFPELPAVCTSPRAAPRATSWSHARMTAPTTRCSPSPEAAAVAGAAAVATASAPSSPPAVSDGSSSRNQDSSGTTCPGSPGGTTTDHGGAVLGGTSGEQPCARGELHRSPHVRPRYTSRAVPDPSR
ncbi:bifunctional DNA primase/polymerase [Streptomyces collinus]|uniref:bifunctional DNA primase/polymerase n=1 Tax=Streptomyces collinus TaxID=42684 RepID=UPI0037CF00A9